jgi:hypothetical protein
LVGVCSYLLVSFWFTRIAANQSSLSAFLTNRVGDCFLTIGMFAILWCLGNKKKNNVFKCEYSSASYTYVATLQISKAAKNKIYICSRSYEAGYPLEVLFIFFAFFFMIKENNKSKIFIKSKKNLERQIRRYSTSSSNLEKRSQFQSSQVKLNCNLGSYLAGLIEGDGYIGVQDPNTDAKVIHRPKIIIAFNINDKPLAKKLSAELNVGRVLDREKSGIVILQILAKEDVLKIINLINGFMRTPKIEALHRAIRWINERDNISIPLLRLDTSPLDSNNWLAGFTDADGCFSITVYDTKKNGVFLRTRVQTSFRIEVKQNYSRDVCASLAGSGYFNILSEISSFFTVNLYTRTRKTEDKIYYAYVVVAHNSRSHGIVRNYFDRYPLYSSKYLAYKDWCLVQDLQTGNLSKEKLDKIKLIKNNFNSKRQVFDFSYLDCFYFS